MNEIVKKNGIKYGLIIGLISVCFYTIAYVFDETLFVNWKLGIGFLIVFFVLMLMSVISTKKEQEGFISFKDAFSAFVITGVVHTAITAVFNITLFNLIDPDFALRLTEMTTENTIAFMERAGAPEERIEEALVKLEEKGNQYSIGNILKGTVYYVLFASVIGALVAAFMKKERPIFDNPTEE